VFSVQNRKYTLNDSVEGEKKGAAVVQEGCLARRLQLQALP
jgi:hypothetical protein